MSLKKKKKKQQNVIVTVVEIFGYSIYQADPLAGSYLSSFKEQYAERDVELSLNSVFTYICKSTYYFYRWLVS